MALEFETTIRDENNGEDYTKDQIIEKALDALQSFVGENGEPLRAALIFTFGDSPKDGSMTALNMSDRRAMTAVETILNTVLDVKRLRSNDGKED